MIVPSKCFEFSIDTIGLLTEELAGIYAIHCNNGKSYIGQSKNLKSRLKQHYQTLLLEKHSNPLLQEACNEHGINSFQFEILEVSQDTSSENLIKLENYWLELYETQCKLLFNIQNGVKVIASTFRLRTIQVNLSPEEREQLLNIASRQERTLAGQIRFWILEKLNLQNEAIRKEQFHLNASKVYEGK